MGSNAWVAAKRIPVTLSLLIALAVWAFFTDSVMDELPRRFLRRFGFAPLDLWEFDLVRVFTSALVTHGRAVFAGALVMVALFVGAVEKRSGSTWALGTFWAVHIWTLLMLSLTSYMAEGEPGGTLGSTMSTLRDVGPSAGYFGCVGFAVATLGHRRLRLLVSVLVVAWLGADLAGVVAIGGALPQELSADLAHLIAFPSGWIVGAVWSYRNGRRDQIADVE